MLMNQKQLLIYMLYNLSKEAYKNLKLLIHDIKYNIKNSYIGNKIL